MRLLTLTALLIVSTTAPANINVRFLEGAPKDGDNVLSLPLNGQPPIRGWPLQLMWMTR